MQSEGIVVVEGVNSASPDPPPASGAEQAGGTVASALSQADMEFIKFLLDEIKTSYSRFRVELWVYNFLAFIGAGLVIYSSMRTAVLDPQAIGTYLASGGLFAVTGWRVTQFLRGDIATVNRIIDRVLGARGR
jgi:hypothetical protein